MLQQILQHYFDIPPQGDQTASILLDVPTHQMHRDNSKFRASDAGKCHRMRYWKRQGKEGKRDIPFETHMALQTGNLLHAFLQYALAQEGVLFASEQELQDEHRIGHFDAILRDRNNNLFLYDFKTVGGKQLYYLKQDLQPKKEHSYQIRTYEQMYLAAHPVPIVESIIAYISRDTLEILELPAAGAVSEVHRDWDPLYTYWERQNTPPMTQCNWECKYCPYQSDCVR